MIGVAKKYFDTLLQTIADNDSQASFPGTEFLAASKSGGQPYAVSIYPARTLISVQSQRYLAIMFIRDLNRQRNLSKKRLQNILGLTPVEAQLAAWIGGGRTLEAYACRYDNSMNTVYTHFRHIKEKAGCNTQMALVAKIRQIAV